MSKEEYQTYLNNWDNLENSKTYLDGEYFDIFKTSDILITDCSSFLAEYFPTLKPIIFLNRKDRAPFDKFGNKIKKGFYEINNDGIKFISNEQSIKFWRLYNEEILDYKSKGLNSKDYIELYINQLHMSNKKYSDVINNITKEYKNIWIIPQIPKMVNDVDEKFERYDIEAISRDMIPDELKDKFEMILNSLSN
jgi:CDP-glycerol glycerophosphotransferase (TagB/SpsB family)